jgi:putative ABC transport system permease protein
VAHLAPPRYVQTRSFRTLGQAIAPEQEPEAGYNEVSSGYFRALEIPLRQGRYLMPQDVESSPWVVVINETMARRFFPNENPLGKQLQLRILGGSSGVNVVEDRPREIVGVVGDIRQWGFEAEPRPVMYGSYRQHATDYPGGFYLGHLWKDLIIRSQSDPTRLAPALQKIVAEVDPDQAVFDIQTMEAGLSESLAGRRFLMRLFGVFGGMAMLLAAVGIYGIASYLVTERTREFGVRIALGAQRKDVLGLVLRGVLKTAMVGVVVGVAGSLALTRLISQFLYGVKATDPLTYSLVSFLLIAVAVVASLIPARRATRIDPVVALRYE